MPVRCTSPWRLAIGELGVQAHWQAQPWSFSPEILRCFSSQKRSVCHKSISSWPSNVTVCNGAMLVIKMHMTSSTPQTACIVQMRFVEWGAHVCASLRSLLENKSTKKTWLWNHLVAEKLVSSLLQDSTSLQCSDFRK